MQCPTLICDLCKAAIPLRITKEGLAGPVIGFNYDHLAPRDRKLEEVPEFAKAEIHFCDICWASLTRAVEVIEHGVTD